MDSATRLVDENGDELTKLYVKNRDLVSIDKIPKHVQQAFISIEDVRFMNTTESILNLLAEHYTEIYWLGKC